MKIHTWKSAFCSIILINIYNELLKLYKKNYRDWLMTHFSEQYKKVDKKFAL